MNEAKKILELIENVDPSDIVELRKLDCLVHCFVTGTPICKEISDSWYMGTGKGDLHSPPKYTRSRDALKSIRPDGWAIMIANTDTSADLNSVGKVWSAHMVKIEAEDAGHCCSSEGLKTEELAELHAVLQAIEYDRRQE